MHAYTIVSRKFLSLFFLKGKGGGEGAKKEALQMIDPSLGQANFSFLLHHRKEQEGRAGEKSNNTTIQHASSLHIVTGSVISNTRPYEVELTRCTTLCLYARHCSTKSTTTSCLSPCKVRM